MKKIISLMIGILLVTTLASALELQPTDVSWDINNRGFTEITLTFYNETMTLTYMPLEVYERKLETNLTNEEYNAFVNQDFYDDLEFLENKKLNETTTVGEEEVETSTWGIIDYLKKLVDDIIGNILDRLLGVENEDQRQNDCIVNGKDLADIQSCINSIAPAP